MQLGLSALELKIARKARKDKKRIQAQQDAVSERTKAIALDEDCTVEEKEELEAKEAESLATLNSLAINVPPFAVSSEDVVFNQFKLVDVVWIRDSGKLLNKLDLYRTHLAPGGMFSFVVFIIQIHIWFNVLFYLFANIVIFIRLYFYYFCRFCLFDFSQGCSF